MKKFLIIFVFIISCLFLLIIVYSGAISEKLTYNLNRNLDVDWGEDHPKITKQNMKVDLLDLSVKWDSLNIVLANSQSALLLNYISKIQSSKCITNISFMLNIQIEIKCDEIRIDYKSNNWVKHGEMNISSTFFFERRVFDDFYDKQGSYDVQIAIKKLFLNKTDSGQHLVKYYFDNNKNLLTHINGRDISLTKQNEGLNIHTPESDYFILNSNFFHNTIKINKTGS
tara:strand:+ start:157 stop:837 length:681 start_codon:yes stop_codon:yes gene_type:complete